MKNARVIRKGVIAFTVVADNFLALSLDETVGAFKNVLQGARLVHRKPGAHQSKNRNQKEKYQKLHGHSIGDRGLGIFGMNMECLQQPGNRAGEEVVQYFGKPQLFRHESGFQLPASSSQLFSLFGIRLEARSW